MPGVDGLRALAVAAVVTYHVGAAWLPGGFLGVDVFLVISGYLITSLLLAERRATGGIDLVRFWIRRARRLLPALFAMIAVVLTVMVIVHPGEVARLRGATLASLGYVANWFFVFADQPYFDQFGRPSLFLHLWSLAVEEQFYLLWPPIMAAGIVLLGRRRLLVGVLAGIAGATVLAWVLFEPFTDPSRIYYGTDTRAVGLLAGVALAFVWPASRLRPLAERRPRIVLEVTGLVALAVLGLALATLGELDAALYQGGFLWVALATAVVIGVAAHPSSWLGKVLAFAPLVWLGLRSYGIYLWHWPIIMLMRPNEDVPLDGAPLAAIQIGLTVLAAALSYTFVETPIRRGGLRALRDALRRDSAGFPRTARMAAASSCAVAVVAVGIAVALLPRENPVIPGFPATASGIPQQATAIGAARAAPASARPARPAKAVPAAEFEPVLAIGDSVMLGASRTLRPALGRRAVVDAAVSRQFTTGAEMVLAKLRTVRPKTVVIHLGNNGYVQFEDLADLMDRLERVPRVVLVNVRVPLQWEKSVNDALDYADDHWDNAVLVDWSAITDRQPHILVDGAHMSHAGAKVYARAIAKAVRAPAERA
jgi:peptidoglycan/LPS O-acetylase OafA/YrhL